MVFVTPTWNYNAAITAFEVGRDMNLSPMWWKPILPDGREGGWWERSILPAENAIGADEVLEGIAPTEPYWETSSIRALLQNFSRFLRKIFGKFPSKCRMTARFSRSPSPQLARFSNN